ncbi:hypothetical protein AB6A40_010051 [Gnathostoma spinigerum]|uniref:BTB domain-containing protein n=1 Tax=Gnathostoma spinigerum TaxID=75299 RepID=A0ABD6F1R5_9BILA
MYLNEKLCDVYFVVGNNQDRERIPAHSYVLAIASSPFDAMFNGGFERMSEIVIPDIEPAAFKILLRYLYTDEIELTTDLALPTLYAANKYLILYLARACICFLEENLDSANVCQILSQSRLFENEDLVSRCWEIIDINAEKVLRSEGFRNIDFNLFESIIMRDSLIVKERILYEAAVEWAESECARQGKPIVSKNIRDALGDALYFIRFPAMTINEFANGPARSGLLTCLETNNIFLYFTAEEKPQLPFPTMPRSGFSLSICSRFQTTLRGTNQWRYRGRRDSIQFCVDRRIFVAGYGLYGSSNGASEYKVDFSRTDITSYFFLLIPARFLYKCFSSLASNLTGLFSSAFFGLRNQWLLFSCLLKYIVKNSPSASRFRSWMTHHFRYFFFQPFRFSCCL